MQHQQQQLTRNQKKKRRQKLSKKFKALAFSAAQQQVQQPKPCVGSELGQAGSWDEQEPLTKRAKQAALPGSSGHGPSQAAQQKLSVSTIPRADRPAQDSTQQAATAEPATRQAQQQHQQQEEQQEQQQQQQQQQQLPPASLAQPAKMSRRMDLSHAAALIHSELLGTGRLGAAATAATTATVSALPAHSCSPAASGCCVGGAGCAGGPAGVGAVGPILAYQTASIVTSTDTSAAAGTAWAVSGALGPSSAQHAQRGSGEGGGDGGATSRQPASAVVGSDCEGEGCGSEDYGQAGEDPEDTHATAGSAGAAEEQGGRGGPVRRGQGQGQGQGPVQRAYVHGNYRRYYGYRLGQAFGGDPRLQCFERGWFANRRCVDVGCNEGLVTLALATRFGCRSMMGVDIDEHLVRKACMHLREERSRAAVRVVEVRRGGTPASERRAAHVAHAALAQTWFVHADFVESSGEDGSFDTITCLSVVKWVHLNRGDAGLEAMLSKFWRLLAPGGLLLLEPQPWKSYKAAAGKLRKQALEPSTYFKRLEELQLRPETLPDLLVDKLGFRLVKRLQPPSDAAAGFDRPMFLFRKPT